jgi:thiol-disulfide isomerase/thioredoxin
MNDPHAQTPGNKLKIILPVLGALGLAIGWALYAMAPAADNSAAASACAGREEAVATLDAAATGDVAGMAKVEPRLMDAVAFTDAQGQPKSLADFRGRTVLLNLWATWCAPCRAEMPSLDALQAEKGSESFEVVALNLDRGTDTKPQDFYAEIGIKNLALYRDGTLASFNALKGEGLVLGLPVTMLIDADGCLLSAMNGPAHWSGPDAKRFVEAALALKP